MTYETLASAIDQFVADKKPRRIVQRDLERLKGFLGQRPLESIGQEEVDRAAEEFYPTHAASTRASHMHSPMRLVLKHAGINRQIKSPKRPKPVIKILSRQTAEHLIRSADDPEYRALLIFLFFTGARISEVMALTGGDVDFYNRRIRFKLVNRHVEQWRPLHRRAAQAISRLPKSSDRIFRWRTTKIGPEVPLRRLRQKTGIHFTYKMARYSFAHWLADEGVNVRDIMDACGWGSIAGLMRIIDIEAGCVRDPIERL